MSSLNKVMLIGNAGKDPEVRYMPNGNAVANLSLATSETWKDQQGQKQERTEWHKLVFYRKLAEIVGEYVKQGTPLYVEGKLQTRKWQDQNGNDKYITEIVVDEMKMLGKAQNQSGNGQQGQGNQQRPQQQGQQRQQQQPSQQRPQNNQQGNGGYNQNQGYQNNQQRTQQPAPMMSEPDFGPDSDDIPFFNDY